MKESILGLQLENESQCWQRTKKTREIVIQFSHKKFNNSPHAKKKESSRPPPLGCRAESNRNAPFPPQPTVDDAMDVGEGGAGGDAVWGEHHAAPVRGDKSTEGHLWVVGRGKYGPLKNPII